MFKNIQFKTHCKGDSHSSKTANIILPGLTIKQRWTSLRPQAKYSRLFNLGEMSCFNQHNTVQWIWIPFCLQPFLFILCCCLLEPLVCGVRFHCYVYCLLVDLAKLPVLAKRLARKTPLKKHNRGEGIICRPKSVWLSWIIVLLHSLIAWYIFVLSSGPTWYTSYLYDMI